MNKKQKYLTSITVRKESKRRLKAALKILARNGIFWSESELLRRLAKMYLGVWRGRKGKPACPRRYNVSFKEQRYVRISWYVDQVLYAILTEKSDHSRESVSRMLDFAIRIYIPQLLEACLRNPVSGDRKQSRNTEYWQARWVRRRRHLPEIFITYECETRKNDVSGLQYEQTYTIIPKQGLSPNALIDLIKNAA